MNKKNGKGSKKSDEWIFAHSERRRFYDDGVRNDGSKKIR
jgi:hypothetical protein